MDREVVVLYADDDAATAAEVVGLLEPEVTCWIAPRDVPLGISVKAATAQAVEAASGIVAVLSASLLAEPRLRIGLDRADAGHVPVVCISIDDAAPDQAFKEGIPIAAWIEAGGELRPRYAEIRDAVQRAVRGQLDDTGERVHDLFVSHSTAQKDKAAALVAALEPDVRCWIAPRDIPPGSTWADAIGEATSTTRGMLVLLSDDAASSRWVRAEVGSMFDRGGVLLPIQLEDLVLPAGVQMQLRDSQWIDARDGDFADHVPSIVAAVAEALGLDTATATPGPGHAPEPVPHAPTTPPTAAPLPPADPVELLLAEARRLGVGLDPHGLPVLSGLTASAPTDLWEVVLGLLALRRDTATRSTDLDAVGGRYDDLLSIVTERGRRGDPEAALLRPVCQDVGLGAMFGLGLTLLRRGELKRSEKARLKKVIADRLDGARVMGMAVYQYDILTQHEGPSWIDAIVRVPCALPDVLASRLRSILEEVQVVPLDELPPVDRVAAGTDRIYGYKLPPRYKQAVDLFKDLRLVQLTRT